MAASYEYLTIELKRGRGEWAELARDLKRISTVLKDEGGELVGVFAPKLGFASNQAIALVRYNGAVPAIGANLFARAENVHRERMAPTVRPKEKDRLKNNGIYVHRWFTIDGDALSQFVDLSNRAWTKFEGSYETSIFGLFAVEPDAADKRDGTARLLLLTWYADHGVWEKSREQAQDTASLFAQRHMLTRTTVARSSVVLGAAE